MQVKLIKEPDNEFDKEAIKVEMEGLGQVGYVANSVHTVRGESMSAGRLYDKIGDTAEGTVLYVLEEWQEGSKTEADAAQQAAAESAGKGGAL